MAETETREVLFIDPGTREDQHHRAVRRFCDSIA
jgi:hypothetical protein